MERIALGFSMSGLSVMARYEILGRLSRSASRNQVPLLAFGLGANELRLVTGDDARGVLRSLKIATNKSGTGFLPGIRWCAPQRTPLSPGLLAPAVAWAHRAPLAKGECPLSSPWTSHRDLLGYRRAAFFDVQPLLAAKLDPLLIHRLAGGTAVPDGWPPRTAVGSSLPFLLRLAGAVHGRIPSDRRCYRLFVHLARHRGHPTGEVARAVQLTDRRIRQLAAEPEPLFALAQKSLSSPALCLVP